MTEILQKVILTGDNEVIVPLTAEEIALIEQSKQETAKAKLEAEKIAEAKAALLAKLGITADEAKLLLS